MGLLGETNASFGGQTGWVALFLSLAQRFHLRRFLIGGLSFLVIAEIVALSPSSLEEGSVPALLDPSVLRENMQASLATGIPLDRVPEYSVDQFQYVSTQGTQKQWKLLAKKAFLYHREKLVHAREVVAYLYNPDGNVTLVAGLEAKFLMTQRDLEVFGAVKTKFPDGFTTESEYLRYLPNQHQVLVPPTYEVKGHGRQPGEQEIIFNSLGLEFDMATSVIELSQAVRFTMIKVEPDRNKEGLEGKTQKTAVPDRTTIESDHCQILRGKQLAHFTMDPKKRLEDRFVHTTQPRLRARSRKVDLNYDNSPNLLQYLVAYDDVLIHETNSEDKVTRYGTGGRADFDTHRNVIVLKEYPQVYQNEDTVTGDVILLHRDTDIVEVEHSNAFSEGQ